MVMILCISRAMLALLVLGGAYWYFRLRRPGGKPQATAPQIDPPRPLQLEYYPSRPEGYTGYTDHMAMSCELTNSLRLKKPEEQYWLVGFGMGYVGEMLARNGTVAPFPQPATPEQKEQLTFCLHAIAWLKDMQAKGTDNAGPSTPNLMSGLSGLGEKLKTQGPVNEEFWSEYHRLKSNPDQMPALPDQSELSRLTELLEQGRTIGATLAKGG